MKDLNDYEFSGWLEWALQDLYQRPVRKIAICASLENGETLTAYYKCESQDKAVFAHCMTSDAMLDTVLNNIGLIRRALEEES